MDDAIRREAQLRHEAHIGHPTHRPLSEGYELVGLRGEEAFVEMFGGEVDMERKLGGDGGRDNSLPLRFVEPATGSLVAVVFLVDIKAARKPGNLIAEVGKVKPKTIYVLAKYDDARDKAELLGWEWGDRLAKAPRRDFGYGVINHFIPRGSLRKLTELQHRAVSA